MPASPDNRAVSALFRAFGGAEGGCVEEACQHTPARAMHRIERAVLAAWVPAAVWVALADAFTAVLGAAVSWVLAAPLAFLALNVLPFLLAGRSPAAQWRLWLAAGVAWAWFHRDVSGITGCAAWGWFVLLGGNAAGLAVLGLRRVLGISGGAGLAWRMFLLVASHALALAAGWRFGWPWGLAAAAMLAAVLCGAVLRPSCQWLGPVIFRNHGRAIRITIDDGPDPRDTPALLDLLDRHQVKAVFFMIGAKVAAHPELAREVLRRGHEIGNHTMTHPQAGFWCAGPWRTRREIADCQRVITEVTGVAPRWFRAPVGHRNLFTHPVAAELGLEVMAWNRRGYDAVETDAAKALARITPNLGPGDIVLTHEATPIAAEVLQGVLAALDAV